jgi:molybdopterin-guanine dinucleotide biosynthesis protein B
MIPALAFTGFHNVGKTTLARRVVSVLRKRGYRVGVVKSTKHRDVAVEPPHKDTALYRRDGVEQVVLMEPERAVCFWEERPPLEEVIFHQLKRCDLVVCEGFKGSTLPKIEVVGRASDIPKIVEDREGLLALVWKEPVEGFRTFSPQDVDSLADFIEGMFLEDGWAMLLVDGALVPMKPFVEKMVASTVTAMVGNLRGGEDASRIDLLIKVPGKGRRS